MAKKAVASLQTGAGRNYTKCIKMVKSEKGGFEIAYNVNRVQFRLKIRVAN